MELRTAVTQGYFYHRRARVLSDMIAKRLPENSCVLDVGCGDGFIASQIQKKRRDIHIQGTDVLVRPRTHLPVKPFNGRTLPYTDGAFDAVILVDVLHHTHDPDGLFREAVRLSRRLVILKDHTLKGALARPTLLYLDWVGNAPHGVSIPANYWPEIRWKQTFDRLNLTVTDWTDDLPVFPWWSSWLFGRSLNFMACLEKPRERLWDKD